MKLVDSKITVHELKEMASKMYGDMVKAVVDLEKEVMAVDAEMHADLEKFLMESGSKQGNLWGINLYPEATGENFLEYDSMINLRPAQGNRSRGVDDEGIRNKIRDLVNKLLKNGIPA